MMGDSTARQRSSQLIWQEAQHQRLFELLDALAFPERAPHFRAHERFRAELADIDASNISDSALRKMTAMFMREWLTRHIYGIDKVLEAFVLDSDLK